METRNNHDPTTLFGILIILCLVHAANQTTIKSRVKPSSTIKDIAAKIVVKPGRIVPMLADRLSLLLP